MLSSMVHPARGRRFCRYYLCTRRLAYQSDSQQVKPPDTFRRFGLYTHRDRSLFGPRVSTACSSLSVQGVLLTKPRSPAVTRFTQQGRTSIRRYDLDLPLADPPQEPPCPITLKSLFKHNGGRFAEHQLLHESKCSALFTHALQFHSF